LAVGVAGVVVAPVAVSGAGWPPVSAGVVLAGDTVVEVPVAGGTADPALGVVAAGVAVEGTAELGAGTASVGVASVTAPSGPLVVVAIGFVRASPAGAELPPQPAAMPPPAPRSSTARRAARRGFEREGLEGIGPYG
jgi:hypothetical protein